MSVKQFILPILKREGHHKQYSNLHSADEKRAYTGKPEVLVNTAEELVNTSEEQVNTSEEMFNTVEDTYKDVDVGTNPRPTYDDIEIEELT